MTSRETCGGCDKKLSGKCLMALDRKWHVDCFKCARCGQVLEGGQFSLKEGDETTPYHEACLLAEQTEQEARTCFDCHKLIGAGEGAISVNGLLFHPHCFKCSRCGEELPPESEFVPHDGKKYCGSCWSVVAVEVKERIIQKRQDAHAKLFNPSRYFTEYLMDRASLGQLSNTMSQDLQFHLTIGDVGIDT